MNNKKVWEKVCRYCLTNKKYFNKAKNTYKNELKSGDFVLVWNVKKAKNIF